MRVKLVLCTKHLEKRPAHGRCPGFIGQADHSLFLIDRACRIHGNEQPHLVGLNREAFPDEEGCEWSLGRRYTFGGENKGRCSWWGKLQEQRPGGLSGGGVVGPGTTG